MPVAIKYTDAGKGVIYAGDGIISGADLLAANREIYSRDLVAEPYHCGLFDADRLTGITITTAEMRQLTAASLEASRLMPQFIVGLYAKDDLTFGLCRMWETLVQESGWITNVFRERAAAVAWVKAEVMRIHGAAVVLE